MPNRFARRVPAAVPVLLALSDAQPDVSAPLFLRETSPAIIARGDPAPAEATEVALFAHARPSVTRANETRSRRDGGRRGEPAVIAVAVVVALLTGADQAVQAAEKPVRPRLCPEDAPEGIRLPPQPGCGTRETAAPKRDTGYIDLGNGTGLRIGGRASAVFDGRR